MCSFLAFQTMSGYLGQGGGWEILCLTNFWVLSRYVPGKKSADSQSSHCSLPRMDPPPSVTHFAGSAPFPQGWNTFWELEWLAYLLWSKSSNILWVLSKGYPRRGLSLSESLKDFSWALKRNISASISSLFSSITNWHQLPFSITVSMYLCSWQKQTVMYE